MSRKMPINVGSFARDRLREWVNSFDVVLTDCDGESNYYKFKFPIHPYQIQENDKTRLNCGTG